LLDDVSKQVVYSIYKMDVVQQPRNMSHSGIKNQESGIKGQEVGRNDPCPCGSGKKWKKCGLLNTQEHQQLMAKTAK
jgi:preprotein translocase subunit SecA